MSISQRHTCYNVGELGRAGPIARLGRVRLPGSADWTADWTASWRGWSRHSRRVVGHRNAVDGCHMCICDLQPCDMYTNEICMKSILLPFVHP